MYNICVRCSAKQAAKRVTDTARHTPFPSPFLPAWDAVHEKRGHTLRNSGFAVPAGCQNKLKSHHAGALGLKDDSGTTQCLDAAIMQGKWETPAMAPSRLVHCSRNMSGPWRDTTKWPRLLRDVG
jgi:hypothetical protein